VDRVGTEHPTLRNGGRDGTAQTSASGLYHRGMTVTTTRSDSGIDFRLDLETDRVLPGRLARGDLHMDFRDAIEVRGIVASLIATEQWQTEETTTDANGTTHTETETHRHELQRLPVMLAGSGRVEAGESRDFRVEVPVPPLGPATLEATVS